MDSRTYQKIYDDAVEYAYDKRHSAGDVKKNWLDSLKNFRIRKWRYELKNLSKETGITLKEVCAYMEIEEKDYPGFYKKLPKMRNTFIGIGMAYGQSLDTINRWITEYGMKRKLYVKDILNDLIWIYLINANQRDRTSDTNYFLLFSECRDEIGKLYDEIWNVDSETHEDTSDLESGVKSVCFDNHYSSFKTYVRENMNSFRTAYIKPRKYLNDYVVEILRVKNAVMDEGHRWTLNSLRGWLDDSMINYLSGSYEYINALDREKNMTPGFKHIPKNKKAHISICLALGMSIDAIDEYLIMMGYHPLDAVDSDEGQLINLITRWDDKHPEQLVFKEKYFNDRKDIILSLEEELKAVNDMLFLREDLKEQYEICNENGEFMYL